MANGATPAAFVRQLRQALSLAATVSTIASPASHTRLLELIVETAAQVIGAHAASLFLLDEEQQDLVFVVALGEKASEAKQFRVPLGQGIAGLVAVTGQPLAVSNAQQDPRHAADMASQIGYLPQSILCVPLFYNDQITGVLELLDKIDAPAFSAQDMERLGLFAGQAAIAIEQSRTHRNLTNLLEEALRRIGGDATLGQQGRAVARHLAEQDPAFLQSITIAQQVQDIVWLGERERSACQAILRGFADYVRQRSAPDAGKEWAFS